MCARRMGPTRSNMRNWIDLRMLALVAGSYLLLVVAWTCAPLTIPFMAPTVAVLALLAWLCAVVAHNALHCPVFLSARLNSAFQVVVSCAYGFPISEYIPGHNLSHHRFTQRGGDVMRTEKAPFLRLNALNLLFFFPRVALDVVRQNARYLATARRSRPRWYRQVLLEAACCWGVKVVLLALDWRRAVLLVVLPHLFAVYAITTVNLLQHDGCDPTHPRNHSRNFTGRVFNFFTFNNGFHGAHHDDPSLHWSLLRTAHQDAYHGRTHPSLEQRSVLLYLISTYLLRARRVRYDGTPIAALVQQPDLDWVPRVEEPS